MIDLIDMRPFRSDKELEYVRDIAKKDEHELHFPTFMFVKGGFPVGYVGIAPAVMLWLDRNRVKVRDSVDAMRLYENFLKNTQNRGMILPVTEKSELAPYVPQVGYLSLGKVNLFVKGF